MATKTDTLRIIDADTHIDETRSDLGSTTPEEQGFKPTKGSAPHPDPSHPPVPYWLIDGHKERRSARTDAKSKTTVETRELLDVEARLRHMDELGTEIQVIYPTLFISDPAVRRGRVESALTRSYNRWLADRCALSKGRLRWICIPPLKTMDKAVEELRWAKDTEPVACPRRGTRKRAITRPKTISSPSMKRRSGWTCRSASIRGPDRAGGSLVTRGRPHLPPQQGHGHYRYPLILGTCDPGEVPEASDRLHRGERLMASLVEHTIRRAEEKHTSRQLPPKDIFTTNRIYVACQMDENLPLVFQYISENNLLVGSDYSHEDPSQDHGFIVPLQQAADRGRSQIRRYRRSFTTTPRPSTLSSLAALLAAAPRGSSPQ